MTPEERDFTLRQLELSDLRGRGGGNFEVHRKWRAVLSEDGLPIVIANGGESEPGSIKDRFIMRTRPKAVLAGLVIAMKTLGAVRGYVYLKGSFDEEERRIGAALADLGIDDGVTITIHRGDDTYVGGEETAVLESIEGRVAWPRPKPPRPATVGLFGQPTLVQNVDTLARVPDAVRLGANYPTEDSLTVTVWGDVKNPGAYDVRPSRTIREVIAQEGGGATSAIGIVFPNAAQAMPLTPDQLDIPLTPAALHMAQSSLGTASILVLNDQASRTSVVDSVARFFERESCGQCPPCVLGTTNLRTLITGDNASTSRATPHNAIRETAWFMSMHGYCSHSRQGAAAVTGLFARWQAEIIERLRSGAAASTGEIRDPFAPDSPERRALDDVLRGL